MGHVRRIESEHVLQEPDACARMGSLLTQPPVDSLAVQCVLLTGEAPELLDLRARILGSAGIVTAKVCPENASALLAAHHHDAIVICHSVSVPLIKSIAETAYAQQRRTRTLLLTRLTRFVPEELADYHLYAAYCWHQGAEAFIETTLRLLYLPDYSA